MIFTRIVRTYLEFCRKSVAQFLEPANT